MIQIDLWFYFVSLIMVAAFVYMYVDFVYFQKYMDFRNSMFQAHIDSMLKIHEWVETERDKDE